MPKRIFSIWKIALLGGLLAFSLLLWLNDHVGYSAKSAILINGHNGNQEDVLAKTVAAFADTHTFVERTLSSTRLQEGAVGQLMTPEEQRSVVTEIIVRGGKKGGLVTVVSAHQDAETAEIISTESTETLLRMSRLYLGNEKEFTSTVIDQAILTKGLINPYGYIAKSVVTTLVLFAVLVLLEPVLLWFRKLLSNHIKKAHSDTPEPSEYQEAPDQRFVPQKLDPTFLYPEKEVTEPFAPQPKASEVVNNEVFGHPEESTGKTPLQSVSVSMEDLPFTFETPVEEASYEQEELKKTEGPAEETLSAPARNASHNDAGGDREPSVLEYKRRLNELLAQK